MTQHEEHDDTSGSPWSLDQRSWLAVAGIALGAILLFAIASAVDLASLARIPAVPGGGVSSSLAGAGSKFSLGGGGAGLEPFRGSNPDIELRPIPGCPDGVALSDRIFIIPDPEACGFRPMAPGERGNHPISGIIIVPRSDGSIGGLDLNDPSRPSIRPDGLERATDYALSARPDGTFEVAAPSGDRLSVEPGVDGRMRISETPRSTDAGSADANDAPDRSVADSGDGERADAADGSSGESSLDQDGALGAGSGSDDAATGLAEGSTDPDVADPPRRVGASTADTDPPPNLAVLPIVVMFFVLGGLALAALTFVRGQPATQGGRIVGLPRPSQPDSAPDFAYEVNALDLLLHEIAHEHDPRRAIVKCFAALETGLGDAQMARRRSETPGRFVQRVLGHFDELDDELSEIVDLFERARFSEHEITADMRTRAIDLLTAVRSHYAMQAELAAQRAMAEAAEAAARAADESAPELVGSAPR